MHDVLQEAVNVGDRFQQKATRVVNGRRRTLTRVIEVIGRPTLSSPVNYRIIRNDAHPHRKGKHGSIRLADLRRKYEAAAR